MRKAYTILRQFPEDTKLVWLSGAPDLLHIMTTGEAMAQFAQLHGLELKTETEPCRELPDDCFEKLTVEFAGVTVSTQHIVKKGETQNAH